MNKETCDRYNATQQGTMHHHLGIRFLPTDDNTAMAEMPINEHTCQYFGILHGGAAMTLAETLAGAGSLALIEDTGKRVCGLSVTANHVGMSAKEGKVIGKATPIHIGKTTHVWNIDITGEDGRLISTERVTNMIF